MTNAFVHKNDKVLTLNGEQYVSELDSNSYVLTPCGFVKVKEVRKEKQCVAVNMILATGESIYFAGNALRFYPNDCYVQQGISRHTAVRIIEKSYWEKLANTIPTVSKIAFESSHLCRDLLIFLLSYCVFMPYKEQENDFFRLFKKLQAENYQQEEFISATFDFLHSNIGALSKKHVSNSSADLLKQHNYSAALSFFASCISYGSIKNCLNSSRHKKNSSVRLLLPSEQDTLDDFYNIQLVSPVGLFVNRVGVIF